MNRKIKLVVNPAAGNHALVNSWSNLDNKLKNILGDFSAEFTKDINDATTITQRAISAGYEIIVAMGGDGTINEVVNGFFDNGRLINSETSLGIISMGTGGDWIKTWQTPEKLEETAARIREKNTKKCDLGLLHCQALNGNPVSRYFINIADAGFGGCLAGLVNKSTKAFGPFFSYLLALLRTLATYKNKRIQIQVEGVYDKEQIVNSVVVANGQFFGGGMWVAPKAQINDGLFDVIIIGNTTRREILTNIHKIYNGTLGQHPKVQCVRGKKVKLTSNSQILIEADGEQPGKLPATFENLPGVLNIIC